MIVEECFLSSVLSVVTLLLLPHAQGNIWLFEDSVLITGKRPGTSGGTRLEGRGRHSVDVNVFCLCFDLNMWHLVEREAEKLCVEQMLS